MNRKSAFEDIYEHYYVSLVNEIHAQLKNSKKILPDPEWQERIIEEALNEKCSFRFTDNVKEDRITPVRETDKNYHFTGEMTNKDFFERVHLAYLVPYFIYARFAYTVAMTVKADWQQLLSMTYQVSLPIKMPGKKEYFWYEQQSRILTLNEHNQVISHINIYKPWREFIEIDDEPENIFVKATVLYNQEVYELFQKILNEEMRKYYKKEVFNGVHWKVINAHNGGDLESLKQKYDNKYRIYDYNKEITELMMIHTGYRFKDIKAIVAYLKKIKVLDS